MSAEDRLKPRYIRRKRLAVDQFELTRTELKRLGKTADLTQACPQFLDFAFEFHSLTVTGLETVPRAGKPIIYVCNHTGTPLIANGCMIPETVLLLSHVLYHFRKKAPRPLMGLHFYEDERTFVLHRDIFQPLGCVAATLNNGIQLLDLGQDILSYPEGEDSLPPYQTLPFFWGFAKIAWTAEALIVPVAVIGPHESRLRIDVQNGPIVFATPFTPPNKVPYHITFLPAFDVRTFVPSLTDTTSLALFSERVRHSIQVTLDSLSINRPLVDAARNLQRRYGHSTGRTAIRPAAMHCLQEPTN
jgi:1-acyl-sn-glycerol-3-phosphate acyltransferase